MTDPGKKRPIIHRLRSLAITLGVLALLITIWWWRQPKTLRLAVCIPTYDNTLIGTEAGFLLHEVKDTYVFRDWSGNERWRITLPTPDVTAWRNKEQSIWYKYGHNDHNVAISYDGRYVAALIAEGKGRRVYAGCDGKLVKGPLLPVQQRIYRTQVLPNGEVYIWWRNGTTCPMYAIKDQQVIASGLMPFFGDLSLDGKAYVASTDTGFQYATPNLFHNHIGITRQYKSSEKIVESWSGNTVRQSLLQNGIVLTMNGAVYGPSGRRSRPTNWYKSYDTPPGGMYISQWRKNTARVYSPVTSKSWSFTAPGDVETGYATSDGRHVFIGCEGKVSKYLQYAVEPIPLLRELYDPYYFALFEYPGQLVGRTHGRKIQALLQQRRVEQFILSPNGRVMVVTTDAPNDTYQCTLLHWK